MKLKKKKKILKSGIYAKLSAVAMLRILLIFQIFLVTRLNKTFAATFDDDGGDDEHLAASSRVDASVSITVCG